MKKLINSVHPEIVDFGSEQDLSIFETTDIAGAISAADAMTAALYFKKAKTKLRANPPWWRD